MDLVTLALSKRIGNIEDNVLEQVLMDTHASLRLKKSGQGMLMLNNNAIIKCAGIYYRNPNAPDKKVKHNNTALQCHYVQETLEIVGIDVYQCSQCHLRCIQKRKRKELRRIAVVK
jgi:aldehyde:ferredoxin oxidoreductase